MELIITLKIKTEELNEQVSQVREEFRDVLRKSRHNF